MRTEKTDEFIEHLSDIWASPIDRVMKIKEPWVRIVLIMPAFFCSMVLMVLTAIPIILVTIFVFPFEVAWKGNKK
jgi:hypothetical protein